MHIIHSELVHNTIKIYGPSHARCWLTPHHHHTFLWSVISDRTKPTCSTMKEKNKTESGGHPVNIPLVNFVHCKRPPLLQVPYHQSRRKPRVYISISIHHIQASGPRWRLDRWDISCISQSTNCKIVNNTQVNYKGRKTETSRTRLVCLLGMIRAEVCLAATQMWTVDQPSYPISHLVSSSKPGKNLALPFTAFKGI